MRAEIRSIKTKGYRLISAVGSKGAARMRLNKLRGIGSKWMSDQKWAAEIRRGRSDPEGLPGSGRGVGPSCQLRSNSTERGGRKRSRRWVTGDLAGDGHRAHQCANRGGERIGRKLVSRVTHQEYRRDVKTGGEALRRRGADGRIGAADENAPGDQGRHMRQELDQRKDRKHVNTF